MMTGGTGWLEASRGRCAILSSTLSEGASHGPMMVYPSLRGFGRFACKGLEGGHAFFDDEFFDGDIHGLAELFEAGFPLRQPIG